jgi:3-methylcrotonyl-CoA carboxylase alpha subunit
MKLASVLIANRGEIACRVIRTAKRMGMRTIAVYSEADAQAPHVKQADEAYCIGPAAARESYLRADIILEVAKKTKAACVHPGYGFLSENTSFAADCAAAGIVFVGPPSSAIEAMGLKDAAKTLVEKAGVPVVPGYHGSNQDPAFLKEKAYSIGYPVLIKAVAGGGGKGMKRVDKHADFEEALASAQREAKNAFGDMRVLIEKYVTAPRHVEIQVFGDSHGNVVHLFERDCSSQRRHQKVIEEAPAPGMALEVRNAMGKAAVDAAKAVGYVGAGTVEFIADGSRGLRVDSFYFMEMNTRLQVEHPVTEMITGLDLVELQFRVAAGEALPFAQSDLTINGHAVEARVYAEDPENDFLPSTGKLWALRLPEETAVRPGDFPSPSGEGGMRSMTDEGEPLPSMNLPHPTASGGHLLPREKESTPGIRVDSGVIEGGSVTPHYDPMIAKVIAHGATRDEALDRLSAALTQTIVAGPKSNVAFLKALANHPDFRAGKLDTGLIEREKVALGAVEQLMDVEAVQLVTLMLMSEEQDRLCLVAELRGAPEFDPWTEFDHFALSPLVPPLRMLVDGKPYDSHVLDDAVEDVNAVSHTDDGSVLVIRNNRQTRVSLFDPFDVDMNALDDAGGSAVKSPMHGKLVALMVQAGDSVTKGQKIAIVEAMKMEHALVAPRDGVVSSVIGDVGAQVSEGAKVVVLAEV